MDFLKTVCYNGTIFHDGGILTFIFLRQSVERTSKMETKRAVIFMDDENDGEVKLKKPLLLHTVLFCPMLTWLGNSLRAGGVEHFFVLCPEKHREEAASCFAAGDDVIVSEKLKDLVDFLQGTERVLVVPGAAVPVESSRFIPCPEIIWPTACGSRAAKWRARKACPGLPVSAP